MKKLLILTICVFFTQTITAQDKFRIIDNLDVDEYIERISGRFSSFEHSQIDTTRSNVLIRTIVFDVIGDTTFLYTQQGEFWNEVFYPYRQRVYKIFLENNLLIGLKIYALPSDSFYEVMNEIDTYPTFQTDSSFSVNLQMLTKLDKTELIPKVGCDIWIYKDNLGGYRGETQNDECKGSFRGANYTTTEFVVYEHEIISWERGWSDDGEQKWGPKNGPYIYKKENQK